MGGRWLLRELFQPEFEHCIKNSGRKNLVFFKVLGIKLTGRERGKRGRNSEWGREGEEKGERGKWDREKSRQTEKYRKEDTLILNWTKPGSLIHWKCNLSTWL